MSEGSSMQGPLDNRNVVVVGRGSGIARAIVISARDAGAHVVAAGQDEAQLAADYEGESDVSTQFVDLTDEASIEALGKHLGSVDHVVSTASAWARGQLVDLDREAIRLSFDTKVIGPMMLAKHLAPRTNDGGSFVIFSGGSAFKIAVGTIGVAVTNGAADTLVRSLAVELAPIRVNGISPGTIDTGAWDALGEQGKADYFAEIRGRNPVRRIGTSEDVAAAVLFAMTNSFVTGLMLRVDGGETLTWGMTDIDLHVTPLTEPRGNPSDRPHPEGERIQHLAKVMFATLWWTWGLTGRPWRPGLVESGLESVPTRQGSLRDSAALRVLVRLSATLDASSGSRVML
jgi:NAD(P)-dependent dehydrogenase (short-subunit alcohol dehydrogenase family)